MYILSGLLFIINKNIIQYNMLVFSHVKYSLAIECSRIEMCISEAKVLLYVLHHVT